MHVCLCVHYTCITVAESFVLYLHSLCDVFEFVPLDR